MRHLISASFPLVFLACTAVAAAGPVDLNLWIPVNPAIEGSSNPASWVVAADGSSAEQTANALTAFLVSEQDLPSYSMRGTLMVQTDNDDDFIGFAFGFQDPAHCYIMDWKKGLQSSGVFIAQPGFAIRKIAAPSADDLIFGDFWSSTGAENSAILASQFGSTYAWANNTNYDFSLDFAPGQFTVVVKRGLTELWRTTVQDGSYATGRFCLYNFSQGNVVFSNLIQTVDPVCEPGGPYSGHIAEPMLLDGSASHDIDGQVVGWAWDFGDGSEPAFGETVIHTYIAEGDFIVTLCVTDDDGAESCSTTSAAITVPVPVAPESFGSLKALFR